LYSIWTLWRLIGYGSAIAAAPFYLREQKLTRNWTIADHIQDVAEIFNFQQLF